MLNYWVGNRFLYLAILLFERFSHWGWTTITRTGSQINLEMRWFLSPLTSSSFEPFLIFLPLLNKWIWVLHKNRDFTPLGLHAGRLLIVFSVQWECHVEATSTATVELATTILRVPSLMEPSLVSCACLTHGSSHIGQLFKRGGRVLTTLRAFELLAVLVRAPRYRTGTFRPVEMLTQ